MEPQAIPVRIVSETVRRGVRFVVWSDGLATRHSDTDDEWVSVRDVPRPGKRRHVGQLSIFELEESNAGTNGTG